VLSVLVPRLRRRPGTTSDGVGSAMGSALLGLSLVAGLIVLL
jgi:hypothetical protein